MGKEKQSPCKRGFVLKPLLDALGERVASGFKTPGEGNAWVHTQNSFKMSKH
jgi:hypothetical protein